MDDTELAYLAGFFDGEGCVSVGKSAGRYGSLMVTVGQIDPRPLARFHALFGGYVLRKRDGRGFRSVHQWRCSAREGAAALAALLPLLVVKADEARLGIEYQRRFEVRRDKTPDAVASEMAERERLYVALREAKHVSYDDADLPRSTKGPGRPRGQKIVRLTAGPGSEPGKYPSRRGVQDPERLAAMQAMRRDGATYQAIGQQFGVKKAAVANLLKRWLHG